MSIESIIGLALAAAACVYLLRALVRAEKL